jgi:GxxExxY protein
MRLDELSHATIGAAVEVHRELGPGLLESLYEEALAIELGRRHLKVGRQVEVPVQYKGQRLGTALRLDLLVEDRIIVEVKSVEALLGVHKAQLLTYLRLSDRRLGLLLNFNAPRLLDGVHRLANNL